MLRKFKSGLIINGVSLVILLVYTLGFPQIYRSSLHASLFVASYASWCLSFLLEPILIAKCGGGEGDPETPSPKSKRSFVMMSVGFTASLLALFTSAALKLVILPDWSFYLGLAMIGVGIGFREWAIITLSRYFSMNLQVKAGQEVVDAGPYRLLRHPSYAGLILSTLGIAVAMGSLVGFALVVVLQAWTLTNRMLVEEEILSSQLGEPYRQYMKRTKRVIPFVY